MGRRTSKPFDPAAGLRRRAASTLARHAADDAAGREAAAHPDTWGVAAETLDLPVNAEVAAVRDARGRVAQAHRTDVFEALHARGSLSGGQLAAARRLEQDMGLRIGLFRPSSPVLVDSQGCSEGATQRMVDAGRRVDAALARIGVRQALLLRALVEPPLTQGRLVAWREVVARETGETNAHVQSALVRAACEDLMRAYQDIDRTPRRR